MAECSWLLSLLNCCQYLQTTKCYAGKVPPKASRMAKDSLHCIFFDHYEITSKYWASGLPVNILCLSVPASLYVSNSRNCTCMVSSYMRMMSYICYLKTHKFFQTSNFLHYYSKFLKQRFKIL